MTEGINSAIGKTSSTGLQPNSTRTFYCWLEENVIVNPFDFLTAEHIQGSRTTGVVSEILAPTDSLSHLSNYVSSEFGDTNSEPYVDRLSTMVAEVNVLRNDNDPEFKMPVAADRKVYFSTAQDIQKALGADLIKGIPIPAGLSLFGFFHKPICGRN